MDHFEWSILGEQALFAQAWKSNPIASDVSHRYTGSALINQERIHDDSGE
jgi:hypothetical protein